LNSTKKGDRLPITSASKALVSISSPNATPSRAKRPPLGCDAMFSPAAAPAQAHLYGRCAA
jgi:hypothetical protein